MPRDLAERCLRPDFWAGIDLTNIDTLSEERYPSSGRDTAYSVLLSHLLNQNFVETPCQSLSLPEVEELRTADYPEGTIAKLDTIKLLVDANNGVERLEDAIVLSAQRLFVHWKNQLWMGGEERTILANSMNRKKNPHTSVQIAGREIRLGRWAQMTRSTGKLALCTNELTALYLPDTAS
jgi:hypothetical protein